MMDGERPRFHLAFCVTDLSAARRFYGGVLGCTEGRSAERWVDFDFFGHQLVTHLVAKPNAENAENAEEGGSASNAVDGDDVPRC